MQQLPLQLELKQTATFDAYYPPAHPSQIVEQLKAAAAGSGEHFLYLAGAAGTGKTHLLQAACHWAAHLQRRAAYVPLSVNSELSVEIFSQLEYVDLVCLDDIQCVGGSKQWEEALFHLFNRLRECNTPLIVGSNLLPSHLTLSLPDLHSRLNWGVVLPLPELNDEQKMCALQLRARQRGLSLPEDVGRYLLQRCPRDMHALFAVLDRLDYASLAEQRRLTIPFVRGYIL